MEPTSVHSSLGLLGMLINESGIGTKTLSFSSTVLVVLRPKLLLLIFFEVEEGSFEFGDLLGIEPYGNEATPSTTVTCGATRL